MPKPEWGTIVRNIVLVVVAYFGVQAGISCFSRGVANSTLNDDASQAHDRPQH